MLAVESPTRFRSQRQSPQDVTVFESHVSGAPCSVKGFQAFGYDIPVSNLYHMITSQSDISEIILK